ncbi:MAG: hypothetical protein AB1393_08350 [Candidatus Edwardsbacteria bacterium]
MSKLIAGTILLWNLLSPRIVKGIDGFVFDSWNSQKPDSTNVSLIINDGSSGTGTCKIPYFDIYGYWAIDPNVFSPPATPSDTGHMSAYLTVNSKTYITHMRKGPLDEASIFPTAFLDDPDKAVMAHAFGVWDVKDTSNVADTLKAEGWLKKNPAQKIKFINYCLKYSGLDSTKVDTSDIFPQVYINLEKQDSLWLPSDSATVRLYKQKSDTTWQTKVSFLLDTLKYGCATMLDSLIFPSELSVFRDASAESVGVDSSYIVGTIVTPKGKLKNNGTITQIPRFYFFIRDSLTNNEVYRDSLNVSLEGGKDSLVAFSSWTATPVSSYAAICSTGLSEDVNSNNDKKVKYFQVKSVTAIELSDFSAYPTADGNILTLWKTEYGGNTACWDLEKRIQEEQNWQDVATIPSTNSSYEYKYLDKNVKRNITYNYRLGQVDLDGSVIWHGPVSVTALGGKGLENFKIWPNPVKDLRELKISRRGDYGIYNVLGQKVAEIKNCDRIDVNLPSGVYMIVTGEKLFIPTKNSDFQSDYFLSILGNYDII